MSIGPGADTVCALLATNIRDSVGTAATQLSPVSEAERAELFAAIESTIAYRQAHQPNEHGSEER